MVLKKTEICDECGVNAAKFSCKACGKGLCTYHKKKVRFLIENDFVVVSELYLCKYDRNRLKKAMETNEKKMMQGLEAEFDILLNNYGLKKI